MGDSSSSASLRGFEVRVYELRSRLPDGLPLTTVPRTLADLAAGGLSEEQIRQAVHEIIVRGLVTRVALAEYAQQRGRRAARLIGEACATETAE